MSTLFVAWQSPSPSRLWFPIGRLDASDQRDHFEFAYTKGAIEASKESGFKPLLAFPDFNRKYESSELFSLFKNRILNRNREDFSDYLRWLDISRDNVDPIEILGLTGGERQTDSLEIFPKVERQNDGTVTYRFFLHGLRYVSAAARQRAELLREGEELRVAIELNNPATQTAVQLQSADGHMLGWAPRYLVADLCRSLIPNAEIAASVHQVNQSDAPSSMRVLVNLRGRIPDDFIPMSSTEYRLLNI